MSVAAQQHGLVALDERGRPLRPAKLWNDTEAAADAERLVERLGGPGPWARACGSVPTAAFTIAKLGWLQRTEPERWAALRSVLLPHDWLTASLTGRAATDRGDASGTGYWSPAEGRYRWDLLALIDPARAWEKMVPPVLGPAEPAGPLTDEAASSLGLRAGISVGCGTGDNMAAALALRLDPGDVAMSIGTSGTVFTVSSEPTADPSGAVAGFADATGRFLPLVCTLNAARVTDTVARLLAMDPDGLAAAAVSAPAGAGGLVLLPYLDGERTPNLPDARGVLAGLRSDTDPADVARAAFEGVVCSLLEGLDSLVAVTGTGSGGGPRRLVLVGGGARSPAYRRILADLSGHRVEVPAGAEQVATGAGVQAAAALHGQEPRAQADDWRAWLSHGQTVLDPDGRVDGAELRRAYAAARERTWPLSPLRPPAPA